MHEVLGSILSTTVIRHSDLCLQSSTREGALPFKVIISYVVSSRPAGPLLKEPKKMGEQNQQKGRGDGDCDRYLSHLNYF